MRREDRPLDDRDGRVLAEIARRMRAEDPDFAAALSGPLHRPQPDWTPVWLRILAFLLLAGGVLIPVPLLVPAAFVVFGIARLPRSTPMLRSRTGDEYEPPAASHDRMCP